MKIYGKIRINIKANYLDTKIMNKKHKIQINLNIRKIINNINQIVIKIVIEKTIIYQLKIILLNENIMKICNKIQLNKIRMKIKTTLIKWVYHLKRDLFLMIS